jgi:signal transduction histidine kinase
VSGFAELLERKAETLTAEQRDEYLARIRESAARMGELLDEVG